MLNILYHIKLVGATAFNLTSILPKKIQPILANIKLTENCNSRCITCTYWRTVHRDKISTERAIQLLDEIYKLGIKNIRFTGGEPLLRRDFFKILETRNETDFHKVCLATNGLLLEKFKDQINNSIITNITVSLDGIGKNNDEIRGIEGYYDIVIRGLSKINKRIKIVSTISKILVNDLEDLILLCKDKGWDYDVNLPENNLYFFKSEEVKKTLETLWPSERDVDKIIEILAKHNILTEDLLQNIKLYFSKKKFKFSHCVQGFVEVNIDSNGNVRSGCYVFKPIGNIINSSLKEIINSKPYIESVFKMYKLECPGCACGYAISCIYENPLANLRYIVKRLK